MASEGRQLRSARQSNPSLSAAAPSHTPPSIPHADDDSHQQPPPRKEQQKRRQSRRQQEQQQQQQQQLHNKSSASVADGGRTAATVGQGEAEEEEASDEEASDEEDGGGAAAAATMARTRTSKRRRPHTIVHHSPEIRKRTRRAATKSAPVTSSPQGTRTGSTTDSGDERDISDFALDHLDEDEDDHGESDDDDEDALLRAEAKHLIAQYEERQRSRSRDSDSTSCESDDELVVELSDDDAVTLAWAEAKSEQYRAPLEDFLALADDPLDDGIISSIWYQDAPMQGQNGAESDGGTSRAHDESPSEPDTDEEADQLLLMRSLDSDSDDGFVSGDGETTDSLDDEDESALIRFGIEVDENEQTLSMAPLQAGEATIDMEAFADNPEAVIQQTASKLGVNHETAAQILTGVGLSVIAHRQSTASAGHRRLAKASSTPAMGEFTSSRATDVNIMIDPKAPPAPSPFSARRSPRRRPSAGTPTGSIQPADLSPTSSRSDSSHTPPTTVESNKPSVVPEPSDLLQEHQEPAQQMELRDVLHAAVLGPRTAEPSEASSDDADMKSANGHLGDLDRWDRVPIGAFRRSRTSHGSRSPTVDQHHRMMPIASTALFRGSPVMLPVKRARPMKRGLSSSAKSNRSTKAFNRDATDIGTSESKAKAMATSLKKVANIYRTSASPRTRSRAVTPRMNGIRNQVLPS